MVIYAFTSKLQCIPLGMKSKSNIWLSSPHTPNSLFNFKQQSNQSKCNDQYCLSYDFPIGGALSTFIAEKSAYPKGNMLLVHHYGSIQLLHCQRAVDKTAYNCKYVPYLTFTSNGWLYMVNKEIIIKCNNT